jgi:hypothetical protein
MLSKAKAISLLLTTYARSAYFTYAEQSEGYFTITYHLQREALILLTTYARSAYLIRERHYRLIIPLNTFKSRCDFFIHYRTNGSKDSRTFLKKSKFGY